MKKKPVFIVSFLLSLFLYSSLALGADDFSETLAKARRYVDEKSYTKALGEYEKIKNQFTKDPGLLIEWARVYTYANKQTEAIKLFEEIRSSFPDQSALFLRELADQYKWNEQLTKSIEIYHLALKNDRNDLKAILGLAQALSWNGERKEALKEFDHILKDHPDNRDAIIGKAEILSWEDQLEQALRLYEIILTKDPEDLEALNHKARNFVWQGYHHKGIALYKTILKKNPNDPDALEGLAFAYHWNGQDVLANKSLDKLLTLNPNRKAANELSFQIKNAQKPFIREYQDYSLDSNQQSVTTGGLRSGIRLDYTTTLDVIYERQVLRKKGATHPESRANQIGLGLSKEFNEKTDLNMFFYGTDFSKVEFTPFTTNTWLTYKPDDCWRFDVAYGRETFQDNDALLYHIITNSASLSTDFRPNRFWFFNLKYERSYYSDDNTQDQIFSKAEYRFSHDPYTKIYYNFYHSNWGEPELNHGYFNPRSINSHSLGLYIGKDINSRLFSDAQASYGYEFQKKADVNHEISNHPTCYAAGSLNYRLSENWLLSARGEFFTTWPDHGQKAYIRKEGFLSLTYNFGTNPAKTYGGSRPYRTTTQ